MASFSAVGVRVAAIFRWVAYFFGARPLAVGADAFITSIVEFFDVAVFTLRSLVTGAEQASVGIGLVTFFTRQLAIGAGACVGAILFGAVPIPQNVAGTLVAAVFRDFDLSRIASLVTFALCFGIEMRPPGRRHARVGIYAALTIAGALRPYNQLNT